MGGLEAGGLSTTGESAFTGRLTLGASIKAGEVVLTGTRVLGDSVMAGGRVRVEDTGSDAFGA